MPKQTKNQKESILKVDSTKTYTLREASTLVKEITFTKFDASVELAIRLGVDPKKINRNGQGCCSFASWHWKKS